MTTPAIYVGAAAVAVANNTLLPLGAIGVTNEGGIKVGPGNWNALPYLASRTDVVPIQVAYTSSNGTVTIPLDLPDPGKALPMTADQVVPITTNTVFVPQAAGSRVARGSCQIYVQMDGTHTLDLSAWLIKGDSSLVSSGLLSNTNGRQYFLSFFAQAGVAVCYVTALFAVLAGDTTKPTIVSATVTPDENGRIYLVASEECDITHLDPAQFSVPGHPITAVTAVDSTNFYLTTSTAFVFGEARTLAATQVSGGTNNLRDIAGNLLDNVTGLTIQNRVQKLITTLSNKQDDQTYFAPDWGTNSTTANPPSFTQLGTVGTLAGAGYLQMQMAADANGSIGLGTSNTLFASNGGNCEAAVYIEPGLIRYQVASGTATTLATNVANGTSIRLNRDDKNVVSVLTSTDNWRTSTTLFTFPGTLPGTVNGYIGGPYVQAYAVRSPKQLGFVLP